MTTMTAVTTPNVDNIGTKCAIICAPAFAHINLKLPTSPITIIILPAKIKNAEPPATIIAIYFATSGCVLKKSVAVFNAGLTTFCNVFAKGSKNGFPIVAFNVLTAS